MKNYKVRIDMDGVLVNLKDGFLRKFCLPDPYKIYDNLGNHDLFALCKDRLPSDFWTDMDREFWRHLDPLPHAKELVEICENFFGADNVSIMSRPIEHGDCLAGKYDWILRNMPA